MKKGRASIAAVLIIIILFSSPLASFANFGLIIIDGYYDDWEDKPYTEVYKGSNPKDKVINLVSTFRDDSDIYVHINFSQQYSSGIKNMEIEVLTNLGDGYFQLRESDNYNLLENKSSPDSENSEKKQNIPETDDYNTPDNQDDPDEEAIDDSTDIDIDIQDQDERVNYKEDSDENIVAYAQYQAGNDVRIFNVYKNNLVVGEGYMTIVDWQTTEAEFYIPLNTITSQPDGITEISLQIKKLGPQWVHTVGAGTGPFLGVGISLGFVAAIMAILAYRRKRNKRIAGE